MDPINKIIGFEVAIMKSLEKVFPEAKLSGCLFHFGSCIWRRLQACKLSINYKSDSKFRNAIRLFLNHAFVKTCYVWKEYNKIRKFLHEDVELNKSLKEFIQYFESTFLFRDENIGSNCSSRYEHKFWSVAENVTTLIPRTSWMLKLGTELSIRLYL
jgi:hypothetical protein